MSFAPHTMSGWDWARSRRVALFAAAGGGVAFLLLVLTPLAGPHPLTQGTVSYLVAFNFWLALPLGCLVLLMVQYLTGGSWGILLRPVLESATRTFLLLAVMFVPIAVGLFLGERSPYPWARPLEAVAQGRVLDELRQKTGLLNPGFVLVRSAAYLACWTGMAYALRMWSARWRAGDETAGWWLTASSGPGLVVYAVTVTFAAIDWVMSLEPFWRSTMYPALYGVSHVITGFAFATAAVVILSSHPPLAGRILPVHRRDLGGLMLTFVMLWAYLAFSQFLLIWAGNLPEEVPYYLKRTRGGWGWVAAGLLLFHFAVPFGVLLFTGARESARVLLAVAVGLIVMRFIDTLWWIEPAFPHRGYAPYWLLDVAATVGLGGVWAWSFLGGLQDASWPGRPSGEIREDRDGDE